MFVKCADCGRLLVKGQTCICGTTSQGVGSPDFTR